MLTVKKIANRLSVSEMTVYRWISQKKLRAYKISRNVVRVEEEDLEKFLEVRKK